MSRDRDGLAAQTPAAIPELEEEAQLIEQASSGDEDAFERLYRTHIGTVYSLCVRMMGDVHAAADTTQEIFVRVWRKLSSYRGRSSFRTWLYRLSFNVILRQHRRMVAHSVVPLDEKATTGIDESVVLGVDLQRAISALPPKCRAVLVMHDMREHTHREIGEVLRISPGTSKAHLHRARRILRKELER